MIFKVVSTIIKQTSTPRTPGEVKGQSINYFLRITIKTNFCSGIRGPVSEERYINGKETEIGGITVVVRQPTEPVSNAHIHSTRQPATTSVTLSVARDTKAKPPKNIAFVRSFFS